MRIVLLSLSWLVVFSLGFGLGVYLLPILSAPAAPGAQQVAAAAQARLFSGAFRRDLAGSDLLHWGEGRVTLTAANVVFDGRLAPGPAYRLYLVPGFVQDGDAFLRLKHRSLAVGDIRTFENFIVPLPAGTRLEDYDTVVVWCEAFSRFITAARYR